MADSEKRLVLEIEVEGIDVSDVEGYMEEYDLTAWEILGEEDMRAECGVFLASRQSEVPPTAHTGVIRGARIEEAPRV